MKKNNCDKDHCKQFFEKSSNEAKYNDKGERILKRQNYKKFISKNR